MFFFFSSGAFARMWKAKRGTVYIFTLSVIIVFLVIKGTWEIFILCLFVLTGFYQWVTVSDEGSTQDVRAPQEIVLGQNPKAR